MLGWVLIPRSLGSHLHCLGILGDLCFCQFNLGVAMKLRVIPLSVLISFALLFAAGTSVLASLDETGGDVEEVDPPSSVERDEADSSEKIILFEEQIDFELSSDLNVDIKNPGTFDRTRLVTPADGGIIQAGATVHSYFIHFDPDGDEGGPLSGSVTFDTDVLGLIVLASALDASDPELGADDTEYPTGDVGRRMELDCCGDDPDNLDVVGLSADRRTVNLTVITEGGDVDQVRIITAAEQTDPPAPEDSTPPTITGSASPGPNANGWNNTEVVVSYSASDDLSGIDPSASELADDVLSSEGVNLSASGTAVDLAGNAASVEVGGINIDLTPPTVIPPSDQTVVATSAAGAEVSFSASASDDLSGVESLVGSPTSGSTFSIGITVVSHTATDLAGNVTMSAHSVTVIGPRDVLRNVIDDLSLYVAEDKRFGKAIKEIEKSLDAKLWADDTHLDPKHGRKVFDRLRRAIKQLMHVAKKPDRISGDAHTTAKAAIDDLAGVSRFLAATLLAETSGVVAVDPKRQAKVDKGLPGHRRKSTKATRTWSSRTWTRP